MDALMDVLEVEDDVEPRPALLVWFTHQSRSEQWQHLNRVRAEWPYHLEVIEPELPTDFLGVRLSVHAQDLGGYPLELEVSETRVTRLGKHWVEDLMERLADRGEVLPDPLVE